MSQNKCLFHPTRTCYYYTKFCRKLSCEESRKNYHSNSKKVYRISSKEGSLHERWHEIDFRYILLYVALFLLGLIGVYFGVQFYDPICNSGDYDETCINLLASIYFAGLLMALSTALAIRELKG
jgi:hypothetical protein